jgi:hypothetical protein
MHRLHANNRNRTYDTEALRTIEYLCSMTISAGKSQEYSGSK